ncbi:hypothetical protein HZA76_03540 [Candidatus Roizmanbacteria bacterium]|nr:hypothetical protein [Candidatus Roizmanbacteria bacterium]
MTRISDRSLKYMSFIQAFSLFAYIGLIAFLLANGDRWFGRVPNYLGPLLFLTLFSTSALICAIITLYFPFILFWEKKQTMSAVKLVVYTARWLILFTLIILVLVIIF